MLKILEKKTHETRYPLEACTKIAIKYDINHRKRVLSQNDFIILNDICFYKNVYCLRIIMVYRLCNRLE